MHNPADITWICSYIPCPERPMLINARLMLSQAVPQSLAKVQELGIAGNGFHVWLLSTYGGH
jgi:hypothetical protein